jgi:hypothetical protein
MERILRIQGERQQFLMELEKKKQAGRLVRSSDRQPVPASEPHLMFRCTVIPEEPFGLRGIAADLALDRKVLSLPSLHRKNGSPVDPIFGWGLPYQGWQPRAHAAKAEHCSSCAFGLWTIGDDGLAEITGLSYPPNNLHFPGEFSETVVQALLMAEKLRLRAGRPNVPVIIDAQFHHDGTAVAVTDMNHRFNIPDENVLIGPFVVATREEIPRVHQELEREIWLGLGISRFPRADLDFDRAFSDCPCVKAGFNSLQINRADEKGSVRGCRRARNRPFFRPSYTRAGRPRQPHQDEDSVLLEAERCSNHASISTIGTDSSSGPSMAITSLSP